jgi:hypothetical protein
MQQPAAQWPHVYFEVFIERDGNMGVTHSRWRTFAYAQLEAQRIYREEMRWHTRVIVRVYEKHDLASMGVVYKYPNDEFALDWRKVGF